MKEMERMRWRCRRGMLELDIVLGRFIEKSYARLDESAKVAFDALLDMPDTELWDMITGKKEASSGNASMVLELIRTA